jgi:hypothetical protein
VRDEIEICSLPGTASSSAARQESCAIYAQRKSTVEPVLGIVKLVLGFPSVSFGGLDGATGELTLVSMAWNLKRLFNLKRQRLQPHAPIAARKVRTTRSCSQRSSEPSNPPLFGTFSTTHPVCLGPQSA